MRAVPDPRCGRKTKHNHAEVLVCLVIGFLKGRTTIRRSLKWCKRHLKWLRNYIPLKNGIASPATACRILSGIDEELFALEFMEWAGEIMKYFEEMSEDYKKMKTVPNFKPRYPEMMKGYEETSYQEKNRDRYENRWYKICRDTSLLTKTQKEWSFIKTVGKIRQVRIPVERDAEGNDITPDVETFLNQGSRRKPKPIRGDSERSDIQDIGMISDRELSADEMGKIKGILCAFLWIC